MVVRVTLNCGKQLFFAHVDPHLRSEMWGTLYCSWHG
jgi:hypothetical protein